MKVTSSQNDDNLSQLMSKGLLHSNLKYLFCALFFLAVDFTARSIP